MRNAVIRAHYQLPESVTKLTTTPYHPQANSIVESQNKKIIACLQKHVGDKKNFWEPYLITVVLEYNCTINSTTGETPYFLVFRREPRTVLEMLYKVARSESALARQFCCKDSS